MWDNLIAEDPKLKKWFGMSRLEGRAEGKVEARAEDLAMLRDTIIKNLKPRFPRFVGEAWLAIDEIDSIETLGQLLADFAVAPDEEAARRALEAHTQQH